MINKPTIKILVAYHKPAPLFKDDILEPIHLGRALAMQASKDGKINDKDYKWMIDNMIGDDTGDNISAENRYYNEMTALYWAWKNYDKIGNPDFIGLSHYRRFFIFNENLQLPKLTWVPNGPCYALSEKKALSYINSCNVYKFLESYDCITSHEFDIRNFKHLNHNQTIGEQFCNLTGVNIQLYHIMIKCINKLYPDYIRDTEIFIKGMNYHLCNMFIMNKQLFFQYCEFVFPILFEIKNNVCVNNENYNQLRSPAFLAEFLTTIFIMHINRTKNGSVKYINIAFIMNNPKIKDVLQYWKYMIISKLSFGSLQKKYKRKKISYRIKIRGF